MTFIPQSPVSKIKTYLSVLKDTCVHLLPNIYNHFPLGQGTCYMQMVTRPFPIKELLQVFFLIDLLCPHVFLPSTLFQFSSSFFFPRILLPTCLLPPSSSHFYCLWVQDYKQLVGANFRDSSVKYNFYTTLWFISIIGLLLTVKKYYWLCYSKWELQNLQL